MSDVYNQIFNFNTDTTNIFPCGMQKSRRNWRSFHQIGSEPISTIVHKQILTGYHLLAGCGTMAGDGSPGLGNLYKLSLSHVMEWDGDHFHNVHVFSMAGISFRKRKGRQAGARERVALGGKVQRGQRSWTISTSLPLSDTHLFHTCIFFSSGLKSLCFKHMKSWFFIPLISTEIDHNVYMYILTELMFWL